MTSDKLIRRLFPSSSSPSSLSSFPSTFYTPISITTTPSVTHFFPSLSLPISVQLALHWSTRPLRLYKLHDIPLHLQDNEFILTGYRAFYSWSDCIRSILYWHNESVNIWTHVLGAVIFFGFLFHVLDLHPNELSSDRAIMALYHASALICLACSGIFHTFHCHSHRNVFDCMAVTDYTGIATLLFGSFVSLIYFAFRPYPHMLPIPLTVTSIASLAGIILPWFSFFRSHKYRVLRTGIFFTLSTSILLSVVWATYFIWHEITHSWTWSWALWTFSCIGSYCGGALIYAFKIPECFYPGKFDLVGSSHQLWHIAVILGAISHWQLLIQLRDWRLIQSI